MKNKNNLSEDELRQKIDGFSMKQTDEKADTNDHTGFIIVDQPIYPTHGAEYSETKSNK